jgi:glycosyltransferase involved in cell wall biosynthesis
MTELRAVKKITILFDHEIFLMQAAGGVSRYFIELIRRLDQSGNFDPVIFAGLHASNLLTEQRASLPARVIGAKLPFGIGHNRVISAFNQLAFRIFARALQPRIYHATYYRHFRTSPQTARIITVHDMVAELYADPRGKHDPTPLRKRRAISEADAIICVSAHTQRDMLRLYPEAKRKSFVVRHGAALARSQVQKHPLDAPYFLYVGQRDKRKNHDLIKQAFALAGLKGCKLVFFGGGAPNDSEMVEASGQGHVYAQGNDGDLATWYSHALALLYPSRYEGFGMPLLEAMSLGCPVVAADASSIPEVAGDACALIDPEDLSAWTNFLRKLYESEDLRCSLAARGSERSKSFSWERCAAETADVYHKSIAGRKRHC